MLARNTKLFVFVLLAAVVAQPLDARATQIFFAFSGEITSISDIYTHEPVPALPDWGIEIGGPFSGTLTIDTDFAPSDPNCDSYGLPLVGGTQTFKIGEFVTLPATNQRGLCFIVDPNGIFAAGAIVEDDVNLTPHLTVEFQDLHINWSGSPVSSLDDLVTELDSLTFTGGFYAMGTSCNMPLGPCPFAYGSSHIVASFDHVKAWAVPEPSALMLMGIGLVGLGWMGRRRQKQPSLY